VTRVQSPFDLPKPTDDGDWFGQRVEPGEGRLFWMPVTQTFSGEDVWVPVYIRRGEGEGPCVFVTGAVHGDEINGAGAIRHIIRERPFELAAGTLVLVPVVNMPGFERHTRYMPDRRDLNRTFPGSRHGSLASRVAAALFETVVRRCAYGVDLHTAAIRRTNFPNVRADMTDPDLAAFARAFGAELIVSGRGPKGSLRNASCGAGCRTLILEAGEVWRVESGYIEYAVRGITNCLQFLGMVEGEAEDPPYRAVTDASSWVRATSGGFLEFHVSPGTIVDKDDPIATSTDLAGEDRDVIRAPRNGIVLGMTTIPSVAPGDPVCHLAYPRDSVLRKVGKVVDKLDEDHLHERVRGDLSRSVHVTEHDESDLGDD